MPSLTVPRRRRRRLMFVTGGTGLLGWHLTANDASRHWEIYAPGSRGLDVRDGDAVRDHIRHWRPTVVVHLAYRKDDRAAIVDASTHVARATASVGARLVHVSTDMVFSGRSRPYTETDECTPHGDYGTWKAEAERAVLTHDPSAVVVRTSLMYGTDRLAQIQHDVDDVLHGRRRLRFFTDEQRCPAHAADVAAAIATLADRPEVTGPLHVAGPEAISRADLARRFAVQLGLDPDAVPIGTMAESGLARAGTVLLDSSRAADLGIRCRSLDEAVADPRTRPPARARFSPGSYPAPS